MIRMIVQDDRRHGASVIYALDGIRKRDGRGLISIGWEWVRGIGCPGMFSTKDRKLAELALSRLPSMPIYDNHTNERISRLPG